MAFRCYYFVIETSRYVFEHNAICKAVLIFKLTLIDSIVDDMRIQEAIFESTTTVICCVVLVYACKSVVSVEIIARAVRH